ncbi:MAG: hypothetical protein IPM66_09720 [Acidobacteriota bacterium]|nr:MAG: hypothetical protein IPM66_09720 [Acidobacteriota bacterium]
MKRFAYLIMAIFCLGAMITTASAQNAAGDWDVVLNTPGGARNFKAVFKVDGDKLTGELKREGSSEPGGLPIQGKVNGSEIQFSYTVKYQDNDLLITMSGKVDGDSMSGKADFGGFAEDEWSAKRSGSSPAAAQSSAVNVTGDWEFTVETDAGSGSPSFTFKQEGEKLTGKYKGLFGESDLTGAVKGDQIEFSFKVSGQVEGTMTYTGTTDGKTMKGKVNLAGVGEGTFTGKRK